MVCRLRNIGLMGRGAASRAWPVLCGRDARRRTVNHTAEACCRAVLRGYSSFCLRCTVSESSSSQASLRLVMREERLRAVSLYMATPTGSRIRYATKRLCVGVRVFRVDRRGTFTALRSGCANDRVVVGCRTVAAAGKSGSGDSSAGCDDDGDEMLVGLTQKATPERGNELLRSDVNPKRSQGS